MGLKKIFLVLTLCPAFAALLGTAAFAQAGRRSGYR